MTIVILAALLLFISLFVLAIRDLFRYPTFNSFVVDPEWEAETVPPALPEITESSSETVAK